MLAQVATHELVCRTCGGQLQFVRYADETHCLHVGKSHMHEIEPPTNAARLIARAENDAAFHRSVAKGLDVITPVATPVAGPDDGAVPQVPPHPGDAFHRHMLACQQCGEHRFALCEQGQVLYATMLRDWPGAELGQDKFQRATAAQSAVEAWYAARFYR